jgi:hypothetical protein
MNGKDGVNGTDGKDGAAGPMGECLGFESFIQGSWGQVRLASASCH